MSNQQERVDACLRYSKYPTGKQNGYKTRYVYKRQDQNKFMDTYRDC